MLILHKLNGSPPARAVMMVIEALGLTATYKDVSIARKENLTPDYLKKNPQHTIPLLEDGDFVIWDSHAITAYLVSAYAKDDTLYPKDLKKRAVVDQRLHFDSGILFPRARNYVIPVVYQGQKIVPTQTIDAIIEAYDLFEAIVKGRTYLAGDHLTIADICCVATISSLNELVEIDSTKYPSTTAWIHTCSKEEFYQSKNVPGCEEFGKYVKHKLALNNQ